MNLGMCVLKPLNSSEHSLLTETMFNLQRNEHRQQNQRGLIHIFGDFVLPKACQKGSAV